MNPYDEPENPGLPPSDMELDLSRTALVVTDPQIDFLSPDGVTWDLVGKSVTQNKTVENLERLATGRTTGRGDKYSEVHLILPRLTCKAAHPSCTHREVVRTWSQKKSL